MSTALVARLDSAGDVLISGPAVRAVAAQHSRMVVLAGPNGSAAARLLPGVDEVIEWQAPWVDFDSPRLTADHVEGLVKQLRDLAVDRAFVLTSFHQSPLPLALLCRIAGVPWIGAICDDYPGSLLDLRHHVPEGIPEHRRALSLATAAGCPLPDDDDGALRVLRTASLPTDIAEQIPDRFIAFHPGAAVPARRPSPRRSAEMVRALARDGHHIVVTGGPAEAGLTRRVTEEAGSNQHGSVVDLGGRTSLAELAAVFAAARVVVAPNTGPAHLAAAVGTPVVSLFAPVVPADQWRPFGSSVTLLGDQQAPCRGTRARTCPIPGHPCLDGITDEAVTAAVRRAGGESCR
jgi:ADP-heptose:LPS heptosyltransferase